MKSLHVSFDACGVSFDKLNQVAYRCTPAIERVQAALHEGYDSPYSAAYLPFDSNLIDQICQLKRTVDVLKPRMLIVIGIGGSNLGTIAIQQAIFGSYQMDLALPVYYVDTVDPDAVMATKNCAERELLQGHAILINIITKSGRTTETIANGCIFIDLVKKYAPDNYQDYIVFTTDQGSPLWTMALKEGWKKISIPKMICGRYSVLSAVGLFPLAIMGVDIKALAGGAANMVKLCTDHEVTKNIAALSAAFHYCMYQRGVLIHNFFPFSVDLRMLGYWYRQLVAESIGKEYDNHGNRINVGITPLVSIGSIDLHSLVELHLSGPSNTSTLFLKIEEYKESLEVPHCQNFDQLVAHIQGKSLSSIMHAMLIGTQRAYQMKKRPFIAVTLPEKTAEYIGQLMQWKMLEIMYLGHLFEINPFEQPQVELYKKETRALLAHE